VLHKEPRSCPRQEAHFPCEPPLINTSYRVFKGGTIMKRGSLFVLSLCVILVCYTCPAFAGSVEVSGYTDEGIFVQGELDINSDGTVDGNVTTDHGKDLYVEGEMESGGCVSIDNDGRGGGGYDLDID
jgi:hypothetical protein